MLLDRQCRVLQESEILDLRGILQIDQDAKTLTLLWRERGFKQALQAERREGAGCNLLGDGKGHGMEWLRFLFHAINYPAVLAQFEIVERSIMPFEATKYSYFFRR